MSNRLYDVLKMIALILLPALGTAYFGLAVIWNLPNAQQVVGTITVIDTFLGVLVKMYAVQYNKSDDKFDGTIVTKETDQKKTFMLEFNGDPNEITDKDHVIFKVV